MHTNDEYTGMTEQSIPTSKAARTLLHDESFLGPHSSEAHEICECANAGVQSIPAPHVHDALLRDEQDPLKTFNKAPWPNG